MIVLLNGIVLQRATLCVHVCVCSCVCVCVCLETISILYKGNNHSTGEELCCTGILG